LDEKRIALGLIEVPIGRNDLKIERFIEDEIVVIAAANHDWSTQRTKIQLEFIERILLNYLILKCSRESKDAAFSVREN
jgi:hypothetical protein